MKKLSILFVGLLLLTGFAFANDEFSATPVSDIDISATLTWGVDLNTGYTGFTNVASMDAELWWLNADDEIGFSKAGDDNMYGSIAVTIVGLKFDTAGVGGGITLTYDTITAKIVLSPITIQIYAKPGMSWGNVAMIDAADAGIAPALTGANTTGGFTVILPFDPVTLKVYVVSDGDWLTNTANDYAAGLDATIAVAPITINLGGFYGWFNAAATWGGTAKAKVSLADIMNGLDVTVAADIVDPGDYEIGFGTVLNMSEANADDVKANVALNVVYGAASDLDASIAFTEPKAMGLMDNLGATATITLLNLMSGTIGWTIDVTGVYTMQPGLTPSFGFGYGSDQIADLMLQLVLGADFTGIDLTTITLLYDANDLTSMSVAETNDIGIFTVAVNVAF
jgi:hypothetical protein